MRSYKLNAIPQNFVHKYVMRLIDSCSLIVIAQRTAFDVFASSNFSFIKFISFMHLNLYLVTEIQLFDSFLSVIIKYKKQKSKICNNGKTIRSNVSRVVLVQKQGCNLRRNHTKVIQLYIFIQGFICEGFLIRLVWIQV